jgi:acetylornithine deacetylase
VDVSAPTVDFAPVRTLLEELVAIESVNPTLVPGGAGEAEIGRFVADWLERRGIEVEYHELAPARANVVGRVRGSGGGRSLMLNAHLDTVALGGPDGALVPRVDGARLYGRGAYDMKASVAAIMSIARAAADLDLSGDVIVTAVADEEAFSIGSERIAESVEADAAIVTEPTELRIAIAHKGFVWLELETLGRAEHGSRYDLGVDAIAAMGPALVGLAALDERLRADGREHPLLGGPSVHASLIEGGQELSTYPERCLVKVERRTLPGETIALVEQQLGEVAPGAEVRTLFAREPLETPADSPIVEVLTANAARVLGAPPEHVGVPFWTDAALFAAAGIPTVVFGPGGDGAHAETEWVDLEDVERTVAILLATVAEFCA